MVNDIVSTVLDDFEKEEANLWYLADSDSPSFVSEKCNKLEDYLNEYNFVPMAVMDDFYNDIYVIFSSHNPTTLCAIDVITSDEHWYKIFGDLRDRTNYNYIYHDDRNNLYRAFADMCIWMHSARFNGNDYRVSHLINMGYKKVE